MKKIFSNKKILIIGSTGFLGKSLFDTLYAKGADVSGTIRKKQTGLKNRFILDLENKTEIDKFYWQDFDVIVDCSGYINYERTTDSVTQNIKSNILNPLSILSHLSKKQKYFYCSTHTVLVSEEAQNPYSLSKLAFEKYTDILRDALPQLTIFRIPGLFDENRKNGLLYLIRENFNKKKQIELNHLPEKWHGMYLPRATDILVSAIFSNFTPSLVTVGYPVETNIIKIIKAAESSFGYKIPITLKKGKVHKYTPHIQDQKAFYNINKSDFEEDLKKYFNSIK